MILKKHWVHLIHLILATIYQSILTCVIRWCHSVDDTKDPEGEDEDTDKNRETIVKH